MNFGEAIQPVIEALLIGFLVGAQREAAREETERQPGVRDFILIAVVGAVAGIVGNPYLTIGALLSVAALLATFYLKASERTGVTTEMAAIATFSLGFLCGSKTIPLGAPVATAATVLIVFVLESKRRLHQFIREAITEREFADTVRFLATIFVIYPLLPAGTFGPYDAISPRETWLFIILVSSVSYLGYFLEKFMGARMGLRLAGLLSGLASTTAATASFAKSASDEPKRRNLFAQAAVLANAMQFPRLLALLFVVNAQLGKAMLVPLVAMTVTGLAIGWVWWRGASPEAGTDRVGLQNPFRLWPALKFGVLFAAMVLLSKAAVSTLGTAGMMWAAGLGGSVDADAAILAISEMQVGSALASSAAGIAVFIALLANAVLKSAVAAYAGGLSFARSLAASFCLIFLSGAATWIAVAR